MHRQQKIRANDMSNLVPIFLLLAAAGAGGIGCSRGPSRAILMEIVDPMGQDPGSIGRSCVRELSGEELSRVRGRSIPGEGRVRTFRARGHPDGLVIETGSTTLLVTDPSVRASSIKKTETLYGGDLYWEQTDRYTEVQFCFSPVKRDFTSIRRSFRKNQ